MSNYVDILLTEYGVFCIAPPWQVKPGYLISIDGKLKQKVVAVCTDNVDGEFVAMLETSCGHKLHRIKEKYWGCEVEWKDDVHE